MKVRDTSLKKLSSPRSSAWGGETFSFIVRDWVGVILLAKVQHIQRTLNASLKSAMFCNNLPCSLNHLLTVDDAQVTPLLLHRGDCLVFPKHQLETNNLWNCHLLVLMREHLPEFCWYWHFLKATLSEPGKTWIRLLLAKSFSIWDNNGFYPIYKVFLRLLDLLHPKLIATVLGCQFFSESGSKNAT